MDLSLIVAIAQNGVIGGDNKLLWHLPADLKYFKHLTTNNIIIMGRKTYESIGKPLPNRINIIISRDNNYKTEGCINVNSLENAIEIAANINIELKNKNEQTQEVFVIGGAQIYKLALPFVTKLYVTEVKSNFEGDTFFEKINNNIWTETSRISYQKDEKNTIDYDFVTYKRYNK